MDACCSLRVLVNLILADVVLYVGRLLFMDGCGYMWVSVVDLYGTLGTYGSVTPPVVGCGYING